jgi:hypothetical protein
MQKTISSVGLRSRCETLFRLVCAAKTFCFGKNLKPTRKRIDEQPLTTSFPARRLQAAPRFDFAVYSLRDGSEEAELEDSCSSRGDAESLFTTYQTSGFAGTTFFLVNWPEQRTLRIFRYDGKETSSQLKVRQAKAMR